MLTSSYLEVKTHKKRANNATQTNKFILKTQFLSVDKLYYNNVIGTNTNYYER